MSNVRSEGQKLLTVWVKQTFSDRIDEGLAQAGESRSQFIRQAIKEKLVGLAVSLPDGAEQSPPRLGKGGRKKYPSHQAQRAELNDKPSAKTTRKNPALNDSLPVEGVKAAARDRLAKRKQQP